MGKHIGIRNITNGKMKFIKQGDPCNVQDKEITGLNMSSPSHNAKDSRRYLAVSEKRYFDHHAYISFYDFNKNILTPKYLKTVNISEFVYQAIYRKNANHHSGDDKNKAG